MGVIVVYMYRIAHSTPMLLHSRVVLLCIREGDSIPRA